MSEWVSLRQFLFHVHGRVASAVQSAPLRGDQKKLILGFVERGVGSGTPFDSVLSIAYLLGYSACARRNEQAEHVGAFLELYRLSAHLFDDIQDDDLAGTPHEHTGVAIAINNALTLLCLALQSLTFALDLEQSEAVRMEYWRVFHRASLLAVAGQHLDLLGPEGARTTEDVSAVHEAKSSILRMVAECGALLAHTGPTDQARFGRIGSDLAHIARIRDDLRDIFGKSVSPDLVAGKMTYPVACYLESASPASEVRFHKLVAGLPDTMPELRALLYASGAVDESARALEAFRADIHREIGNWSGAGAPHRTLLSIVDALAASIYAPPPLEATEHLWRPPGAWHESVRGELGRFLERMRSLGAPEAPALRPWHLPQWLYDPKTRTLYYPDIEGLPGEVLPLQAHLAGTDDLEQLSEKLKGMVPALVAHEMFHYWRHASGRLTRDYWHEEWAANRLAVAYLRRFDPPALERSLGFARCVLKTWGNLFDKRAEQLLARADTFDPQVTAGYSMGLEAIAVVSAEMVTRLAITPAPLHSIAHELLGSPGARRDSAAA